MLMQETYVLVSLTMPQAVAPQRAVRIIESILGPDSGVLIHDNGYGPPDELFLIPRSGGWPTVRKHHLERHPRCAVCGGTEYLAVHHIKPFASHPELELDPENLLTLCQHPLYNHHLAVGHFWNYKDINPDSVEDAAKLWVRYQRRFLEG